MRVWLAVLAAATLSAQGTQSGPGCSLGELNAPLYRLATQARIQGPVIARIVVGADGAIWTAAYTGHPMLILEVQAVMKRSRLRAACAGMEFEVVYRFSVEGKPSTPMIRTVTFNSPNEFVVKSTPPVGSVD